MPKSYRVKANEVLYEDYFIYTSYTFADGNQQHCLNADKLALLINYKANTKEKRSIYDLFEITTGLTVTYLDAFFADRLKTYMKDNGEKYNSQRALFSLFLEKSLSEKKVNVSEFKRFYNDINNCIPEVNYIYPFKVALIELTKSLAPDLYKEYFSKTLIGDKKENYLPLISEVLNERISILRSYQSVCESDSLQKKKNYNASLHLSNEKLFSLKNHVFWGMSLKHDLFKKDLNSKEKGDIGEVFFSDDVMGEVVGHLGDKVDVRADEKQYSIKTSYSSSWNNHLAYFHSNPLYNKFKETSRVATIAKEENFKDLVMSFFLGEKREVDTLVLQKIKMDVLNRSVAEGVMYKVPMDFIKETMEKKSYILNSSDLILVHEGEQFMKLNFKERSNKGQIMLIVTVDNMEQLYEKGLVEKKEISSKIEKVNKKAFKMA